MENKSFGFAEVWNKSLEQAEKRTAAARDHLWASELGRAAIDNWLKLRGTEQTNPPNARSLRKFEAGNVFEWIVSLILRRAGILIEAQKRVEYQYPGLIAVSGKPDFIVGGIPDVEKWRADMVQLDMPEVFKRAGIQILEYLAAEYPDGLEEMPLEIKSVSAFMFEALERKKSSSKIHRIQTFHYLKSMNYERGNIIYICRDDLRIMEFPIFLNSKVEDEYRGAIEAVSKYHFDNVRPPLEKPVLFDEDIGKFAKNFNIAYSGFLTMLYGFKDQKEFDDKYIPIVSRFNRVIGRIKRGDKMTAKNEEVKTEIEQAGFKLDEILSKAVEDNSEETE